MGWADPEVKPTFHYTDGDGRERWREQIELARSVGFEAIDVGRRGAGVDAGGGDVGGVDERPGDVEWAVAGVTGSEAGGAGGGILPDNWVADVDLLGNSGAG